MTKDHTAAPQKHQFDNELPQGTQAPISAKDFASSPWIGGTVRECALWLQGAGPEVGLNREYFTVMDGFSREDDTVLACRIVGLGGGEGGGEGEGGEEEENGLKVEYFPQSIDSIAMEMATNEGMKFDEKALNYQRSRLKDGKPDRSHAGPYH